MQNRVSELRKKRNMTQKELASMLGVAQNTLSYWEQGKYDIDSESMGRIAEIFGVSIDYLLCRDDTKNLSSIPNIFPIKTKKVPLLGDIACGEPIFAEEQHGEFLSVSDDLDVDFCLRAKGDSMIGARIQDGDVVFIRSQPEVNNGQIAAVLIGNEATLKRVYYYPEKQKLVLSPENPAFEPLVYVGRELEEVRILGLAVAFQSRVK